MTNNYLLQYKTYDELLAEVMMDFKKWASNGMIDGSELIKVAQKINKRLGNKLRKEKQTILYVEKGRVRLPLDFYKHTAAAMCFDYKITQRVPTGSQREILATGNIADSCNVQVGNIPFTGVEPVQQLTPSVCFNQCGETYEILETTRSETRRYTHLGKLKIHMGKQMFYQLPKREHYEQSSLQYPAQPHALTHHAHCHEAYIENKFLHTNFDEGKVYFSYLGDMEDDNGNLIVLDHPLVNDYYEYALKQRIIENLMANGEIIPQNLFQLIEARYKVARVEGESLINMPDFAEMELAHTLNRRAMYNKYYLIFK